jgi:hypothetical protein
MGGLFGGNKTTVQSTSNTYDPVHTAALARLADAQAAMGTDQWTTYKTIFAPYEADMVKLNRDLLPNIQGVAQATMDEQMRDLELNKPIKDALRASQQQGLEFQKRSLERGETLEKAFLDESMDLENVDERVARARQTAATDVQQAFQSAEGEMSRSQGRFLGSDPSSFQGAGARRTTALSKAATMAGATTAAEFQTRQSVEDRNFQRLATAQQLQKNLGLSGLAGIQSFQGSGTQQVGNYSMNNPVASAQGFYAGATGAQGSLANRVMSSTTTNKESGGSGLGAVIGGVAGSFLGGFGGMAGSELGKTIFN